MARKTKSALVVRFANPVSGKTEELLVTEAHKFVGTGTTKVNTGTNPIDQTIVVPIGTNTVSERSIFVKAKDFLPESIQEQFNLLEYWPAGGLKNEPRRKKGEYIVNPDFLKKASHSKTGDPDFRRQAFLKISGQSTNMTEEEFVEKLHIYATKEELEKFTQKTQTS